MPYRQDPYYISALWGRVGAAILLLIATGLQGIGYVFDLEAQEAIFDGVSNIFAGVALIQITVSKIRESKKVREN